MVKRVLVIGLVLSIVIGIGVAGYFFLQPQTYVITEDPNLELISVSTDTIVGTVIASGRLEAVQTESISFQNNGIVSRIFVEEGMRVEPGVLLAELEKADLIEAVQLAELELQRAELQLDKLLTPPDVSDLSAAQAALDNARAQRDRLFNGPEEADVAAAEMSLASARASLQQLLSGPDENTITVQAANLRKAEIALAQAQFDYNAVAFDSRLSLGPAARLEQATIDYETALASFNLAVKDPENAEILAAQSQVAQAEASLARLNTAVQAADLAAAEAQIAQAEASLQNLLDGPAGVDIRVAEVAVESARINLDRARRNVTRAELLSPIEGTIVSINMEEGQAASPANTMVLSDLSNFKLIVDIDEIDIYRIATGQPVAISLDSLPEETFRGTVSEISLAPTTTSAGGIVAYPVTILVDGQNAPFKIGMNVNATIETERLEDVVVVENRVIQLDRANGRAYVDKLIDDQIVRTEVVLGQRSGSVSQIVTGVEAGDTLVLEQRSRRDQLRNALSGGPPDD